MSRLHNTEPREPEHPSLDTGRDGDHEYAAWEMIENGRYMPRRIRGSFPGRELG